MTNDIEYLQAFATKHKIVFQDEGECGFGRECVGLSHGDGWIDHNPHNLTNYEAITGTACAEARENAPEDAYHKHDCLAVLGRGDGAVGQLANWMRALEAAGTVCIIDFETGATGIQALVSGVSGRAIVVR